jgi:hypothetical protein
MGCRPTCGEEGENYIKKNFMIGILIRKLNVTAIIKSRRVGYSDIGGTCSTNWSYEKFVLCILVGNFRGRKHFQHTCVNQRRDNIKM